MSTAERLRKLREEKGLSQTAIARLLGIDRTTYVKYENGNSIRRNLQKLADFFEVSTDYLLGRDESPRPAVHEPANLNEASLASFNPSPKNDLPTPAEAEHIRKYRTLTPEQKSAVDCLVEHFRESQKESD